MSEASINSSYRICPDCIHGRLPNGSMTVRVGNHYAVTPGTICPTCNGTGKVCIFPAGDKSKSEEPAARDDEVRALHERIGD